MSYYYDREGKPLNLENWSALFSDKNYQQIAATTLGDGTLVSTVWLGMDRRLIEGAPQPLIFETMVFRGGADKEGDQEQQRYSTEAEARAGHEAMVKKYADRIAGQTT